MSSKDWQAWFEAAWADREENVYPRLFGPDSEGIFTLSHTVFLETFKQESFDPRWMHYGVFEYKPTTTRASWLYVTSGMSNAWEDDEPHADGPSGLGCEFVMQTTERSKWAILRLQHLMAFQILLQHGRYLGRELIAPYDRVPLRAPISHEPSDLQWLMVAPPVSFDARFTLASGWVELYQVFGATESEATFAREKGGDKLVALLTQAGAFPVTDHRRHSIC